MDKRASRERMRPRAVAAVVLAVATAVGTTLAATSGRTIALSKTGTYASEIFDDGGAEIVA